MDEAAKPTKSKKARRREKAESERKGARQLDEVAALVVDEVLEIAPGIADGTSGETAIDVSISTVDAGRFVVKRVNEALMTHEYLDELAAYLWSEDESLSEALSTGGAENGIEIRLRPFSARADT